MTQSADDSASVGEYALEHEDYSGSGLLGVDGAYTTPPSRPTTLARVSPSLAFYPRLVRIIFRSSAMARRGLYGDRQWSETSLGIFRALEMVGIRFEITGLEHLAAPKGPCLIVSNHMSSLETAVLPSIIRPVRRVTFVVKRQLMDYPVFRYVMRSRDPVAVTQTNPRADLKTMLTEGAERLSRGISLVVFPEGARRPEFKPARFNTIGVKLAHRANVPIVPLALLTDAWPLGRRLSDFGRLDPSRKVRFAFGAPISVSGRGVDEHQEIIEFIQQHLRRWAAEDETDGAAS